MCSISFYNLPLKELLLPCRMQPDPMLMLSIVKSGDVLAWLKSFQVKVLTFA